MASNTILDLTEDRIFKKSDWMGKTYPASDVPEELAAFRKSALEIPTVFRDALLPNPELTVDAFVALALPTTQETLISYGAKSCFNNGKPTEHISCLKTRKLPSREFMEDAELHVGQALLNGAQSIKDPAYKGEGLPLCAIQYWREMYGVADAQAEWRKSITWLEKHSSGTRDFSRARDHLSSLAWNTKTLAPGANMDTTTWTFARLVSNQMLTTTLVDIMVEHIGAWVKADEARSKDFEVVSLMFMNDIQKANSADDYKKKSPGFLHKLEQRLKGSSKVLLFPVHLPSRTHFDGFEIDYKQRTLSYGELQRLLTCTELTPKIIGDSLKHQSEPKPIAVFEKLQWWLSARFGGRFRDLNCAMEHGRQSDGHSCGICVPNMIAHRILYDPLGSVLQAPCQRAMWFNRVVAAHKSSVSTWIQSINAILTWITLD